MDDSATAPDQQHGAFDMDEAIRRHEDSTPTPDDALDVARLFNNIGSDLTAIDKHNVGDGPPAMKLDKEAVMGQYANQASQHQHPAHPPHPRPVPPRPGPPPPHAGVATNIPTVNIPHAAYEKEKKATAALKRKVTKLEKDIKTINEVLSLPNSISRYKIITDDVDCTCSNVHTLLNVFTTEVQKRPKSITITKC
jgi:hypothetical protein